MRKCHGSDQAPVLTPHLVLGVSGGTTPVLSPASRPAVTPQLSPAPPFHSETCSALQIPVHPRL